jgi:ribosomal protein S18 acetylase RimI-like enzyme
MGDVRNQALSLPTSKTTFLHEVSRQAASSTGYLAEVYFDRRSRGVRSWAILRKIEATMTEISNTVDYRVAVQNDETDILAVLEEVAPDIPVPLDTPANQDAIKTIIIQCRQSGKSWVAVDQNDKVIGFVLAKRDLHDDDNRALSMRYIGVSADARRRGIFSTFMERMKANGVPLTASVLHGNKSAMADRLVKVGFTKTGADASEQKFRWAPATSATASST